MLYAINVFPLLNHYYLPPSISSSQTWMGPLQLNITVHISCSLTCRCQDRWSRRPTLPSTCWCWASNRSWAGSSLHNSRLQKDENKTTSVPSWKRQAKKWRAAAAESSAFCCGESDVKRVGLQTFQTLQLVYSHIYMYDPWKYRYITWIDRLSIYRHASFPGAAAGECGS